MSKTPETYMRRATLVSLYLNLVLVALKASAVIMVNSLAIVVDLGISFVGLAVSVILYYSIKLASRPADLGHNYGYGKVENVCEGLEGVILIGIALAMSFEAMGNMVHPEKIHLPWVGFGVSVVASLLNFIGAYYIYVMAKRSSSPAIHAEAIHWRMEGVISGAISCSFIVAILVSRSTFVGLANYVDPIAALVVSVFLVFPSSMLAKSAFFKLLDASAGEESQLEILKSLGKHIDKYCEFKDIKTRTSGRKKFVELKIIMSADIGLKKCHDKIKALENDLKSGIPECELSIMMEPCRKDCRFVKSGENCPYMHDNT